MAKYQQILYAEDNENDIELTLSALEECHLKNRIDIVRDGQEVLDYLFYKGKYENRIKETPLVILLDIKMPKLDGIEALKIIKENDETKLIPVVMLTSSDVEKDLVISYKLGVNAYVVKPIEFDEFMETVKKLGFFWGLVNKTIK